MTGASPAGTVQPVADKVYACITPGSSNAGIVVSDASALVFDSLTTPAAATALIEGLRSDYAAEPGVLVNSHHHADHMLGNQSFPASTQVIAHVQARKRMQELGNSQVQSLLAVRPDLQPALADVRLRLPGVGVQDTLTIYVGEQEVQLQHLGPAHTEGDLVAYLPAQRVLFAGDIVFAGYIPVLRDASASGWLRALEVLRFWDIEHLVPGHGPVTTKDAIEQMIAFLVSVRDWVQACLARGASVEQAEQEFSVPEFAVWERQERLAPAVRRVYHELATMASSADVT